MVFTLPPRRRRDTMRDTTPQKKDALERALDSPEMRPFAMFTLDMGAAKDPQTGEPLCPSLEGKFTPLWEVEDVTAPPEVAEREDRKDREARVELYRSRVMAGLTPFEGDWEPQEGDDDDETPLSGEDEDRLFWGGATPTERLG